MKHSTNIQSLISISVVFVLCLCMSSCDPFHQYYRHTVIYQRDKDLNEYMVFFKSYGSVLEKDTLLLKSTKAIEEYTNSPVERKTRDYWVKFLVKDQLAMMGHTDSIGIYSIADHKLQAMMYHPTIEKRDNLTSSALYPNPFSEDSWVLDFKDSEYNKNEWGVNISDVAYTLKRLETP